MSNETTKELLLSKLADSNIPALTQIFGKALVEACGVCFENQKHSKGLTLQTHFKTNGTTTQVFRILEWEDITETTRRCWNDLEVAVEHAAYGIAILLVLEFTEYTAVERVKKGPGFDYWLTGKIMTKHYLLNVKHV